MNHVLTSEQYSKESLEEIFELTDDIKNNPEKYAKKLDGKIIAIMVITTLALLSIFAIFRVPMSPIYIMILTSVAILELILYIANLNNKKVEE